ncbi:uncharacterized protein LOC103927023 [Pyrus x bretschneideri]|uniref:uncharacterized protein LOC103927023 n=1 Tax=Pyrus x bretschneideri TaxID=225117 RepID=UPI002030398C|nr:uncharacterized protein LOC103927023 [Pyrus x bretschneideri]
MAHKNHNNALALLVFASIVAQEGMLMVGAAQRDLLLWDSTSGSSQPPYDVPSRTNATGSTPRSGGGKKSEGHTVLRSTSDKGNGVVSVVTYPSSKPSVLHWASTERWLQQRYEEIHECRQHNERFRVLGYQWRALRFNDDTRQSTVKVLAACRLSEPESIALMQQPHCLAVPYLRRLVAAGLATIASCNHNLMNALSGTEKMRILCIGQGGGSLPLFLASEMQGRLHC